MTWIPVALFCASGLAIWYGGYMMGHRMGMAEGRQFVSQIAYDDGKREGLETAYHTAKNALDAPSEGTSRSIVGRAIVRKLRALAEGTGDAS